LSQNEVGDEGALALARSRYLGRLTVLNLAGNRLQGATVEALAASPRLRRLNLLVSDSTGIAPARWAGLQARVGSNARCVPEAWALARALQVWPGGIGNLDDCPDLSRQ